MRCISRPSRSGSNPTPSWPPSLSLGSLGIITTAPRVAGQAGAAGGRGELERLLLARLVLRGGKLGRFRGHGVGFRPLTLE